jgi:hypothetical protein
VEDGKAPWQLTFHVLSSALVTRRSLRRVIIAERITPSNSTSRPLAASAWSRTVSLQPQGARMTIDDQMIATTKQNPACSTLT